MRGRRHVAVRGVLANADERGLNGVRVKAFLKAEPVLHPWGIRRMGRYSGTLSTVMAHRAYNLTADVFCLSVDCWALRLPWLHNRLVPCVSVRCDRIFHQ